MPLYKFWYIILWDLSVDTKFWREKIEVVKIFYLNTKDHKSEALNPAPHPNNCLIYPK